MVSALISNPPALCHAIPDNPARQPAYTARSANHGHPPPIAMAAWPLLVAVVVSGLVSTGSTQCTRHSQCMAASTYFVIALHVVYGFTAPSIPNSPCMQSKSRCFFWGIISITQRFAVVPMRGVPGGVTDGAFAIPMVCAIPKSRLQAPASSTATP